MKKSKYNYIFYRDNYSYWFNGISKNGFRLSSELGKKIELLLDDLEILRSHEKFWEKLKDNNFIIDDDIDELDLIRGKNNETINGKDYFLVVLPTLNCNYSCWYCIQEHVNTKMSLKTIHKVKTFIDRIIDEEKISSLHIDWFGGEPFMYLDSIVKTISLYALAKCNEASIPFSNTATTNGYFLTDKVHDELINLKFEKFQITIDGTRDDHNKVKYQEGLSSAFDRVLKNIDSLLLKAPDMRLLLRINYTHENLNADIVDQINEIISSEIRSRIQILPRRVWQETRINNLAEKLSQVIEEFRKSGYSINELDIISNFIPCYACKKNYCAINYNGDVVKCTAHDDLYSPNPPGRLNNNGEITWREGFLELFNKKRFENRRCLACRHLPVCMGICPRNYNKETGEEVSYYCKIEQQTGKLEDSIINFINYCK